MVPLGSRSAQEIAAARRLLAGVGRPELDRIARLAARLLGTGSAQVSLLTELHAIAGGAGLSTQVTDADTPLSESLCAVTASCGGPLVLPDTRNDERVSGLAPVASGAVGAYLGVPLVAAGGETVGALCVFDVAPRDWSPADVALLEQLAAAAAAELELAALSGEFATNRARWELAIDAAGIGSFDFDVATGQLWCDDTMAAMFGYEPGTFDHTLAAFAARVHPEDRDRVRDAVRAAIEHGGAYDAEYRTVLPSGAIRWVQARGRAVTDEAGVTVRLLGAASDTTGQRDSEAGVARVVESMSTAFGAVDRKWQLTYVNAEAVRILGMSRAELVGGQLWELFPALIGSEFETVYRAAMGGRPGTVEAYYPAPLNAWYEVRATPAPDGMSLYFLDVTARRGTQELAALSARVGEQLASSLDIEAAVATLAQLVVPRLADWSLVSITEPGGTVRNVAGWHVDPAMRPVLARYAATHVDAARGRGAVYEALRSSGPVILTVGATARVLEVLTDAAAIEATTLLAPESAVVVPLTARGHLVGVLSLCRGVGRAPMSEQEIAVAVAIAERAGLAVDNAGLFAEQRATAEALRAANQRLHAVAAHDRTVARALQDAMLTRLPEPDHLHLVARYLTATGTEQVGGDWYDALIAPGGATTVMIGDVAGHDIAAAAVMGQLRNLLRALVWDRPDDPPSAIVGRLDRAMRDLHVPTLATLVLLSIEQHDRDRPRGLRTLRWTNAGHPTPILVHADGTVVVLDTSNDLLLGVVPDTDRHDHTHPAPPGSTLILYTDGLIETRDADLDAGTARLLDTLRAHHRSEPGELLDAVLADMVGRQPADDVAVLAVRFHPEDEPRPPEAGPRHE